MMCGNRWKETRKVNDEKEKVTGEFVWGYAE